MASDQHFNVQRAVPFLTPTKNSCEFSWAQVSQHDVGAEDADDAEAGFLKQTFHVLYFNVLVTDGTRKTGSPFFHDQCPKIIQQYFKTHCPKDHFFAPFESNKISSFHILPFQQKVFHQTTRGGAGEGW